MKTTMTIIVPKEEEWRQFLIQLDDGACSGLGSCDHCNRKMYPKRSQYLKSWIVTYIKHKKEAEMPKLFWIASDNAKMFNLGEFHREKCSSNDNVQTCTCEVAQFFRSLYNHPTDDQNKPSLDQIVSVFLKLNR